MSQTDDAMKTTKGNSKSATADASKIKTPVPPQVQYPLESPDSKKNQQTKPGNQSNKK